ncbi:unnamed protein product [Lactuca virosa]|uniref:Uncharacterized protein n=1 Tax=Lactuca virosa TaxID=75947 RepID=A0AAU9M2M8_9ASTR|nr:unnamed protein product [Lactuca virosa]
MCGRIPGRSATKRRRHASEKESKFSTTKVKVARTTRCGNCLEYGHNKRACSKRFRRNSIDVPRNKLCIRRGDGRIGSAKTGNDTPTISTQESVVQQVLVADERENVMGENVMQEGYNVGESVVQQVPVVEVPTVVEEGVVQEEGVVHEVPVIHIQDGHMMQEGGTSQTSVMQGSDTFRQVGSSIRIQYWLEA